MISARRLSPSLLVVPLLLAMVTVLQESSLSYVNIEAVRPDIMLLLVIDWSLLRGVESGMIWGLGGGILIDMFSGLPFGTSSAAYVAAAGVTFITERALSHAHVLLPIVAAAVGTVVYYTIGFIAVSSSQHSFFLGSSLLGTVVAVAIFNALVNPLIFTFARGIDQRLRPMVRTSL